MDGTLWLLFVTSLLIGYSGALIPGPLLTLTVSESARQGFRSGPLLVAGHGIAELVLLIALVIGLSPLLRIGLIRGGIAVTGGLFLLWMGCGMVRSVWQRQLSLERATLHVQTAPVVGKHHILTGALVSISNPYWIIWWAAVGAAYVAESAASGALGLIAFYSGHILSDLTWYSLVAGIVAGGGRMLNDNSYRAVIGACGLFLGMLGAYFVLSGLSGLV